MTIKLSFLVVINFLVNYLSYGQQVLSTQEREVWSDFLKIYLHEKRTVSNNPIKQLVIIQNYLKNDSAEVNPGGLLNLYFMESQLLRNKIGQDSIWLDLLQKYEYLNAKTYYLDDTFNLNYHYPVILVDNKIRKKVFNSWKGWKRFYRKYPDSYGILGLSRVAISNDKKRVVLSYDVNKESHNGGGYLILLEKQRDEWKIFYLMELWVS